MQFSKSSLAIEITCTEAVAENCKDYVDNPAAIIAITTIEIARVIPANQVIVVILLFLVN
jgi:hypothetical protein